MPGWMKKIACVFLLPFSFFAQNQVYDDFEGGRTVHYGERTGVLDSAAMNPAKNKINSSNHCGLYVRNAAKKFANIKMSLPQNLTGVEAYATYLGDPPKMNIKVYTSAPPGTLVEILLTNKGKNNDYPAGTHSQYQAYTTKSNEWEELSFLFSQIPEGSETAANQIDQVVLLFNPNSSTSDTYYFDDLSGPPLLKVESLAQPDTVARQKKLNQAEKKAVTNKNSKDKK